MTRISIIIPIFNLSEYIGNLLHNIIEFQFHDLSEDSWEILIVDDGSTDDSYSIIAKYIACHPNAIRYIRTENRGVSSARNLGISRAEGEYICFADGDDLIVTGALTQLLKIAKENNCDLLHFDYSQIDTIRYKEIANVPQSETHEISARVVPITEYLRETRGLFGPPPQWNIWQNLYRREFLLQHNCRFEPKLSVGEDNVFMWSILKHAPEFAISDSKVYLYQVRKNSAVHNTNPNHIRQLIKSRLAYVEEMFAIMNQIEDERISSGISMEIGNVFYTALGDMIMFNTPMSELVKQLLKYKHSGGKIKVAHPRFKHYPEIRPSWEVKVKRWFIAYPINILLSCTQNA